MVNSMTAFSKHELNCTWGHIYWEIRSFNQRYLDIYIDLPNKNFNSLLWIIRKKIKDCLFRGKIECSLQINMTHDPYNSIIINKQLVFSLIETSKWIKKQINESMMIDPLSLLCYPGVVLDHRYDINYIQEELLSSFETTLHQLVQHRQQEGSSLKQHIMERLHQIYEKLNSIRQHIPHVLQQKRQKLLEFMQSVSIDFNTTKLEQELLIITQKMDISEEIDRLFIHIQEMHNVLIQKGPIGRRLDFIAQELQREANTLTAKSIDAVVIHLAISLKVFIEQIREQAQNIE